MSLDKYLRTPIKLEQLIQFTQDELYNYSLYATSDVDCIDTNTVVYLDDTTEIDNDENEIKPQFAKATGLRHYFNGYIAYSIIWNTGHQLKPEIPSIDDYMKAFNHYIKNDCFFDFSGKQRIKYWFYSSESIDKISEKFSHAFQSEILDIDYENVYEWAQQTIGDIYVNISRNHTDARIRSPVLVYFEHCEFENELIKSFGIKLQRAFRTHIYRGRYTYQNRYNPQKNALRLLQVFEVYN